MSKPVISLYLSLIAISAVGIVATVLTASTHVDYGFQVKRLQIQHANLQNYANELNQSIASEKSLELAGQYALSQNFTPVQNVVTLTHLAQLALR